VNTATMSRTWQHRIAAGRRIGHRAGTVTGAVCALLAVLTAVKVFLVAPHPDDADVMAIAHRVDNQRAAAGTYAANCVRLFLTTPATRLAALQPCLTLPKDQTVPQANRASVPPPWVIDTPEVYSVIPQGSSGEADLYSVTVMVDQRPYAAATPARAFYRLPVSIWHYQPRAADWPTPTSDPGLGADVRLSYDHPVSPSDHGLYAVVTGFITTYLTATSGLDRYVVADSWIKPIGGYQNPVQVKSVDTSSEVPETPEPGTRIHARATVVAQTSQFATVNYSFPLKVENSGGTWMIADIDSIPQINGDSDAVQAGTHN
jgi:Conjugative transposon protein TcpC